MCTIKLLLTYSLVGALAAVVPEADILQSLRDVGGGQHSLRRVVYIKTHSTGSSTLTNILHRACETYGAACFVQPPYAWATPGRPTANRRTLRWYADWSRRQNITVDVWTDHAIFEPDVFEQLIAGHVTVSILREPVSRVLSSYGHVGVDRVRSDLRKLRAGFDPGTEWEPCGPCGELMSAALPFRHFGHLDLVMLTHQYDVSLVLLRRLLGLSELDVAYLPHRVSRGSSHWDGEHVELLRNLQKLLVGPEANLTGAARQFHRRCVGGDEAQVYSAAVQRFNEQWDALGSEAQQSVEAEARVLRTRNMQLARCCSENPDDAYCESLREENIPWVDRRRFPSAEVVSGNAAARTSRCARAISNV